MKDIHLKEYDVRIGSALEILKDFLKKNQYSQLFVVVDEHTEEYCLPLIAEAGANSQLIKINSGEVNKSLQTSESIWRQLKTHNADRFSLIINLGGGVIGDMGGFCASCYMRGIDFIQIPTTLLSQVDASVGGKLGVDFDGLKNFIGLFNNPKIVIVDPTFLKTLTHRDLRSGFAEMIKHALIKDPECWQRLKSSQSWEDLDWTVEIFNSILIKKRSH